MELVGKIKKNPVATIAVVSLSAGALIFAGVKTYRHFKNKKAENDALNNLDEIKQKALEEVKVNNLTEVQAKSKAEELYDAMNGIGTDLTAIKRVLIDENPTMFDVYAIVNAFGIRDYGTFGAPLWGDGEKLNLMGWIKKEISSSSTMYDILRVKFTTAGFEF